MTASVATRRIGGLRRLGMIAAAALMAVAAVTAGPGGAAPAAAAATSVDDRGERGFDPGFIISDYNFFNDHAMTEQEIQAFLVAHPCKPKDSSSPCLSWFQQDTVSQPDAGAGHCAAYDGAKKERASRIIAKVAEACGISPRVLLVLLQKEQSLITRPGASGYLRATGYGCPDTADCNAEYFGFFNQVYNAAWQFRQYTQQPVRDYHVGTVDVRYHPNAACGGTPVQIRNQATANLYNYTPYQPNAAALANVAQDGDECSAYGNLNFWILYNRWFGPTDTVPYPAIFAPCLNLVGGQPCRPAGRLVPTLAPAPQPVS